MARPKRRQQTRPHALPLPQAAPRRDTGRDPRDAGQPRAVTPEDKRAERIRRDTAAAARGLKDAGYKGNVSITVIVNGADDVEVQAPKTGLGRVWDKIAVQPLKAIEKKMKKHPFLSLVASGALIGALTQADPGKATTKSMDDAAINATGKYMSAVVKKQVGEGACIAFEEGWKLACRRFLEAVRGKDELPKPATPLPAVQQPAAAAAAQQAAAP